MTRKLVAIAVAAGALLAAQMPASAQTAISNFPDHVNPSLSRDWSYDANAAYAKEAPTAVPHRARKTSAQAARRQTQGKSGNRM